MTKDVSSFEWPTYQYGGDLFRKLVELTQATDPTDPDSAFAAVSRVVLRQQKEQDYNPNQICCAASIAIAYLGHLMARGVIPPLPEDLYR